MKTPKTAIDQDKTQSISKMTVYTTVLHIHYVSNKLSLILTGTAKPTTNSKWHNALKNNLSWLTGSK
jgi:hypothetical protein